MAQILLEGSVRTCTCFFTQRSLVSTCFASNLLLQTRAAAQAQNSPTLIAASWINPCRPAFSSLPTAAAVQIQCLAGQLRINGGAVPSPLFTVSSSAVRLPWTSPCPALRRWANKLSKVLYSDVQMTNLVTCTSIVILGLLVYEFCLFYVARSPLVV